MIIPAKICAVCGSEDIKYKLPCCRKPFCSSLCFKKHQEESPCKGPQKEGGGGGEGSRGETAALRERGQGNRGGEQEGQETRRESDPSVSSSSESYGSSLCAVDTESEHRDGRERSSSSLSTKHHEEAEGGNVVRASGGDEVSGGKTEAEEREKKREEQGHQGELKGVAVRENKEPGKKDEKESEAADVICVGQGVHTPDNKKDGSKQDNDVEVRGKVDDEASPRSESKKKKKERNSKRRREEEYTSVSDIVVHDVEDEGPTGDGEVEEVVCFEENEVDVSPGKRRPSKSPSKLLQRERRRDVEGDEEEQDEEEGEEGELSDSVEEDEDEHGSRVFLQGIEDEEEEEDLSSDGGEGGEEEEEDDRRPPPSLSASIIPGVDDEGGADHELSVQQKDALSKAATLAYLHGLKLPWTSLSFFV